MRRKAAAAVPHRPRWRRSRPGQLDLVHAGSELDPQHPGPARAAAVRARASRRRGPRRQPNRWRRRAGGAKVGTDACSLDQQASASPRTSSRSRERHAVGKALGFSPSRALSESEQTSAGNPGPGAPATRAPRGRPRQETATRRAAEPRPHRAGVAEHDQRERRQQGHAHELSTLFNYGGNQPEAERLALCDRAAPIES
jgi:hypothetical protein